MRIPSSCMSMCLIYHLRSCILRLSNVIFIFMLSICWCIWDCRHHNFLCIRIIHLQSIKRWSSLGSSITSMLCSTYSNNDYNHVALLVSNDCSLYSTNLLLCLAVGQDVLIGTLSRSVKIKLWTSPSKLKGNLSNHQSCVIYKAIIWSHMYLFRRCRSRLRAQW